jgi:hypothetical protein
MDIQDLLKSLASPQNNSSDGAALEIEHMTLRAAASAGGASQATSAIVQCAVAALIPMVRALCEKNGPKATAQDRLLFSLVLAGAITTMTEDDEGVNTTIEISPDNIRDALNTYTRLTGKNMAPFLPRQMVQFAQGESQAIN